MQMNTHLGADLLGRPRFADALVDRLIRNDVRYIFGMPAESVNCLVDAVGRRPDIDLIAVRHESAASWMAVGYAHGSGTVGVCFGTAGPGATHLLPGVYDGLYDRLPVLAISGQVARAEIGTRSFQEIDSARLFRDGTWRSSDIVSPDQIAVFDQMVLSVRLEQTSAHVAIPSDVLNSPVDALEQVSPYRLGARTATEVDKKRVEDLADYLCATPTTVVLGAGSRDVADCARLLAHALDVPLTALPESGIPEWSANQVDDGGPLAAMESVLLIGRPTAGVARYFPSADLIVEITDVATSGFDEGCRRIGIAGDVPLIVQALASAVWNRRGAPAEASVIPADSSQKSDAPGGWEVLARQLTGASVAVDPGKTLRLARRYLNEHTNIRSAWNLEAEGSALPMSIGLALATNDRCYALTDLAALDQYIAELSTAARYEVPVTVICRAESGATIRDLAKAFDIAVFWAADATELSARMLEAGRERGPVLILTSALDVASAPDSPATSRTDVVEFISHLFAAVTCRGIDSAYLSRRSCAALGVTAGADSGLDLQVVADIQAAAMRATAAFKADGAPACVVVTSPAELLAQLNGLYDASFDNASVLLISVETDRWLLDPVDVLAEIAAISVVLDGTGKDSARLHEALSTVVAGGRGVTHIHVSSSAISARNSAALGDNAPGIPASLRGLPGKTAAAIEEVVRAAELITAAEDVAIIVGRGAAGARTELIELASRTGSSLYCTMGALAADVVGEHCAGLVGTSGNDDAMQRIRQSRLVVVVGVSWRGSAFEMVGHNPVISVNTDPLTFLRLPSDSIGLLGDARETLEALVGLLGDGAATAREVIAQPTPQRRGPRENGRRLRAATVAQVIDKELARAGRASTLSVDVGINTLWAYRYVRSAHRYLWTASFATMGFAVPAAVDVAVRNPDDISVAIVGDGGIGITLAELRNAATVDSTMVIVVFNNNALAAIKFESWIMGWPDRSSAFHEVDFASFARHCGLSAVTVRTSKEFGNAFRTALGSDGPMLIDARVPATEAPVLAGRAHIRQFAGLLAGWLRDGKSARSGAWSTLMAFGAEKTVRIIRGADPRR